MKKFLIVFWSLTLLVVATVFAYNSDKGPARQKDGIAELPQPVNDSVFYRGKFLVEKLNYSEQDLQAIVSYLNNR